ncbi:UPF0481 protein At3g47200-like [Camellia sinensis]|uniref:UPF0481 protein At3g47200-like n=1 Tax=Camellia sinensis TaxID=4442 RepID=UPI00103661C4|nr:UPF0481 protein At3g47200-like [Camellia sinensis]
MVSQCQKEIVADEDRTVSIEIKEGDERDISSLSSNEWLNFIIDARGESRSGSINSLKPKIQKVQPMLREVESNKKCYDPRVVSIGPYHHGKPELEAGERIKIPLARLYLKDSSKETVHELYKEVVNVAGEARKCYAEGLTDFTDESFARMMFLDGCFILQYIYGIVNAIPEVSEIIHHAPLVRRDLFLLENQLPFLVLQVLMRLKSKKHEGEKMITAFIKRIRGEPGERGGLMEKIENFFQKNVWRTQSHREMMQQRNSEDNPPIHFLELVRRQYIDSTTSSIGCHITGDWYSRRSARDFTSVGIQFKPSKTSQLTDIDFKSTCTSGTLQLPPIIVDDITKSILLNLVAYEACPDSITDVGVTSYICFMDSLIDQDEDVKVLRAKGILINFLGSDGHVADLFNEIATDLVPSPHAYVEVKKKIEKHHRSRMKIWVADWLHTYFRNPWTFIAVTAAILAITLSVFQTILAAIQTYLTAHPPKDIKGFSGLEMMKRRM